MAARRFLQGAGRFLHLKFVFLGAFTSFMLLVMLLSPGLRNDLEYWVYGILDARRPIQEYDSSRYVPGGGVVVVDPKTLAPARRAIANWLARKYRLSPEPVAAIVVEAYRLQQESGLPATLILAMVSIESNFHPYIRSGAGAEGVMQVVTRVHEKRYRQYGGRLAVFDPIVSMRVGTEVLKDCVKLKGGSLTEGLKYYFRGDLAHDGDPYVAKVMAEKARLDAVAAGKDVPLTRRSPSAAPAGPEGAVDGVADGAAGDAAASGDPGAVTAEGGSEGGALPPEDGQVLPVSE